MSCTTTGPGAVLSGAVAEWIAFRLHADPDVRELQPVALVPIAGEDDFAIDADLSRAAGRGSCVISGTPGIAEGVVRRYRETA